MKRSLLLATLLLGCGGSVNLPDDGQQPANGDSGTTDDGPPSTTCEAKLSVAPAAPLAELRSKIAFAVSLDLSDPGGARGAHPLKVVLLQDGKPLKTLVDTPKAESLEGSDGLGKKTVSFVPAETAGLLPGAYDVEATLGCPTDATIKKPATAKTTFHVARLGVARIDVAGGEGKRVPLMYHAVAGVAGNSFPVGDKIPASSLASAEGEADLDDKDGKPRLFPEPWSDLASPPTDASGAVLEEGATYPVSLEVGSKPDVSFTLGKTARGLAGPVPAIPTGAPPVRIVLSGVAPSDTPVTDKATFRLETTPVPAVGRYEVDLSWGFEAKGEGGAWKEIPGAKQNAKLRFYGVLGNEIGTTAPNLPWVAVVDAVATKIAGKTKEASEVRSLLVQYVYEEMGLRYDRRSGASAYTQYTSSWAAARFELTSFLKRSRGNVVNCTDCASILSTFSNMVGAKLHYAIIGWNFSLNPILGIGGTTPGSPFDSGRMSFSYHAVTTHDASKTISDATLALDGDDDPKTSPFKKLLVQNISATEYLTRLSPGAPEYKYADQITTVR